MLSLGRELGGEERARDMISGKGVSLILADVSIKFRKPVTYPDTVRIHSYKALLFRSLTRFVFAVIDRSPRTQPPPDAFRLRSGDLVLFPECYRRYFRL